MLMAAAVRAPASVAIALFTLAVSAASLVNSPVVRPISGSLPAQAASASMPIRASALRREGFMALDAGFPVFDLALGFVLLDAVALLDLAHQLVAMAAHLIELVVGELAPLLLQLARHLLPVALNAVPVHLQNLRGWNCTRFMQITGPSV